MGNTAPAADTLQAVRRDFPHFRLWREITGERIRYVARRVRPGFGPHTVVTDDLGELRAALSADAGRPLAGPVLPFSPTTPNVARIYDYLLGGRDHYPADREAADSILADFPEAAHVARANRLFVHRAVRYVAAQGIAQFIDPGAELPTSPAVHEAAQQAHPAAHVCYVDNDGLVIRYARALLSAAPGVTIIPGDLRDPAAILNHPDLRLAIDLGQPTWLTGLDLVPPGLVDVDAWRPGCSWHWLTPPTARIIGAVAREPSRAECRQGAAGWVHERAIP